MHARLPHGRYAFLASLVVAAFVVVTTLGRVGQSGAAAPESTAQPITATAVFSELVDTVVVRASYAVGDVKPVLAPDLNGADPVVTHLAVAAGDHVEESDLVAVVAGRPVIAAEGPFPMYRTILPNDRGEDVETVQGLLVRTGFLRSEPDGVFGRSSQNAFKEFAAAHGAGVVMGLSRDGRTQGPTIPKGELAFLSRLPARVASVDAEVGDRVGESLIRLEAEPAELVFDATPDVAAQLEPAQTVLLTDTQTGLEAETSIQQIERRDAATYRVVLAVPAVFTVDDIGRNLRAIVRLHEGQPVLNVPLAAIQTGADGSTSVQLVGNGAIAGRSVTVGRVALGRAVIEGGLGEGDRVVVGWYEL